VSLSGVTQLAATQTASNKLGLK